MCIFKESSFGRKCKCLLIVLPNLLYLDRVGRADFSYCHLEEIWLFIMGLFHLNGNMRKASAFLGDRMHENVIVMRKDVVIMCENAKLKEN